MHETIDIQYIDRENKVEPLTLTYKIRKTNIAQKWANKVDYCIKNFSIDDPERFYGFDSLQIEKQKAIDAINSCCKIINNYQNIIEKQINNDIEFDTLNYLHHIFEKYHGLLNQPANFYISAPDLVKKALGKLNVEVHRCEGLANNSTKTIKPRHLVTWYDLPRDSLLDIEDYNYFTDDITFGTIYLLYAEIGKTLEDLAHDNDQYISNNAYKPFRHFTADFCVRFHNRQPSWREKNKKLAEEYYLKNKSFFDDQGLPLEHPYNRLGYIPLADLQGDKINILDGLQKRQRVNKITLI